MKLEPVFKDHLSYVTQIVSSLEESHKTGLTVTMHVTEKKYEGASLCLWYVWAAVKYS